MPEPIADSEAFADGVLSPRPGRLTPISRHRDLLPWRRADRLTGCFLWWIPTDSFPVPVGQRQWLIHFFDRLADLFGRQRGLRPAVFIQMKVLHGELRDPFLRTVHDFSPIIGLSRKPGGKLPPSPTPEDIKAIQEGRKQFDFNEFSPDYCYWFRGKSDNEQRQLFFGYGGMTIGFLKEDMKTRPPEFKISPKLREHPMFQSLLRKFDFEQVQTKAFALLDGFLPKSKELFGAGLEQDPQYRGLLFIIPLLGASDFFNRPVEEAAKWFELFDVYVNESPADRGILLASKIDVEPNLIDLLKQTREEGLTYPER